jgi:dimeric dUTPase (all-alpha-NTP-PPase superfamily)
MKESMIPHNWHELRPEVQHFAVAMEQRLREKDKDEERSGNSWKNEAPEYLYGLLEEHVNGLHWAINLRSNKNTAKKSIDVANFAMMIWNVSE